MRKKGWGKKLGLANQLVSKPCQSKLRKAVAPRTCWDLSFELVSAGSCQVMATKGLEVASCCSLKKWQLKCLCACDSGCLRMHKDNSKVSTAGH